MYDTFKKLPLIFRRPKLKRVYILDHLTSFNFKRTCDVLRYPCMDAPILCENGGRSVSEHGKCICKCQDGYEGKYCETVS